RPGGGGQRTARNVTPSGVSSVTSVAPSGTGLAGMETSFTRIRDAGVGSLRGKARLYRTSSHLSPRADASAVWPCKPSLALPSLFCAGLRAAQPQVVRPSGGPTACRSTEGGYAMRTFDLTPLYRSTVGFDRLFSMLDNVAGFEARTPGYPPYHIQRTRHTAHP